MKRQNRFNELLCVISLVAAIVLVASPVSAGYIANWSLDDGTTADVSGNNHNFGGGGGMGGILMASPFGALGAPSASCLFFDKDNRGGTVGIVGWDTMPMDDFVLSLYAQSNNPGGIQWQNNSGTPATTSLFYSNNLWVGVTDTNFWEVRIGGTTLATWDASNDPYRIEVTRASGVFSLLVNGVATGVTATDSFGGWEGAHLAVTPGGQAGFSGYFGDIAVTTIGFLPPMPPPLTWNGGAGTEAPVDGAGTWNATNTNWWDTAARDWLDGKPAVFGAGNGSAGIVAVEGTVMPAAITFNATGDSSTYTLTQGTDGLIDLDGQVVKVTTNVDAEIAAKISNGGLNKKGPATLTLSGANALTEATVNAGTLTINAGLLATLNVPTGTASLNATASVTTANVSGTGLLDINVAVGELNVSGGRANINSVGTDTANVSGTGRLDLNSTVGALNVTGGRANVGSGATAATATLSGGIVDASANVLAVTGTLNVPGATATYTAGGSATAFTVQGSNIVNDNQTGADARTVTLSGGTLSLINPVATVGTASYTLAANPTFSPVANNLLIGLAPDPSSSTNITSYDNEYGTGTAAALTDGTVSGGTGIKWIADNTTFTYILPSTSVGYDLSKINLYTQWDDGREDITLNNISFSTVADPATFTPIAGSAVNYNAGSNTALASLEATGGILAGGVYAIQFNFGPQENGFVGYTELEVVGTLGAIDGSVNFPNTNLVVTANSVLDLPTGSNKLGRLTLSGSSTVLTLSGAASASFTGLTGNGTVAGTVIIPSGGKVSPGTDSTIGALAASGLTLDSGSLLTFNIVDNTGAPGSIDQVIVTGADGLTINGGGITILNSDGTDTFSSMGTYNLISYVGSLTGDVSDLMTVLNKAPGRKYTFGTGNVGGIDYVQMTIGVGGYWMGGTGDNANWDNEANWNGIPIGNGDTLSFVTKGDGGTELDNNIEGGSYTSLQFESEAPAFTLEGFGITLTGDGLEKVIIANKSTAKQTVKLDITLGTDGKIDAAGDIEVGGNITGAYGLTKTGAGTLTLSGTGNNFGNLAVGGGALDLGGKTHTVGDVSVTAAAASGDTIGNGDLTGTSFAASNETGNAVISANLQGTAGLAKSGAGTLTLSSDNTYSGDTSVSAGELNLSNQNALQNSTLTTGGTGIVFDSSVVEHAFTFGGISGSGNLDLRDNAANAVALTVGGNGANTIFSGAITGSGSLVKVGDGSLQLGSNDSTYTGDTTIKAGTLIAGGNVGGVEVRGVSANSTINLGDTTGNSDATVQLSPGASVGSYNNNVVVQSGNTGAMKLYFGRVLNFPGTITLGTADAAGHDLTIELQSWDLRLHGVIQDPTGMTFGTAGIVSVIGGGSEGVFFTAANTYTGNTQIKSSLLTLSNALAMQYSTLDMNSADTGSVAFDQDSTLGGLTGSRDVDMSGKTVSIGNNNKDTAYSGILSNGALTKIGSGTLALSGANTYGGGTIVSEGTLLVNNTTDSGTGTGAVTVNGGTLGGTGFIGGEVTVNDGCILAPGDGAGTLTVNNSLAMGSDSTYVWQLGSDDLADLVDVNGTLSIASNWTLKLMSDGGTPGIREYELFTYDAFLGSFTPPTIDPTGTWTNAKVAQDIDGKRIYVSFGLPGDTNGDFVVDAADYIALKTNFGMTDGATLAQGNFDADIDGNVDWDDLQILMGIFGTRSIGGAPPAPEPGSVMLLVFGALAVIRRRRRTA